MALVTVFYLIYGVTEDVIKKSRLARRPPDRPNLFILLHLLSFKPWRSKRRRSVATVPPSLFRAWIDAQSS